MKYPYIFTHIYSYCYDRKSPHLHFVCGIDKEQNNCWLQFYYLYSSIRKMCPIYFITDSHTNKQTQKNPLTFSLMYVIQEESGKRRNNCRSKTHFNDAQTVILQLGITTNDFRFESIGAVFNVFFSRVGSFLFLKKELHIERPGTVCVMWKCFLHCSNNQRPHNIYPIVLAQFNTECTT